MLSLTNQFLAWCRSKPVDEEYNYFGVGPGKHGCAIIQFCEELGLSREVERELDTYPHPVCDAAMETPYTFGALADRVERQGVEQEVTGASLRDRVLAVPAEPPAASHRFALRPTGAGDAS